MSRNPWFAPLAVLVAVVVLCFGVGPARGRMGSVEVAVLVPQGTFHVGDTVTITILVFDRGTAEDATNLSVSISGAEASRNVTATRQAVGTYTGSFQIGAADLAGPGSGGVTDVAINVNATVAGVSGYGFGYVPVVALPPALSLSLSGPRGWVLPGSSVAVNATVLASGTLANPDTISISASLNMPYGGFFYGIAVPMTRTGAGQYSGVYHVPEDTPLGTRLGISGVATLGSLTAYGDSLALQIGSGEPFVLWQHVLAVTPSYSLVEVLVANSTGWPVVGANVMLFHGAGQCYHRECQPIIWGSATTDRLGAARFNLTYPTLPVVTVVYLGNVTVAGSSQTFSGAFFSPSMFQPYASLCPSDGLLSFAPGQTIRRMYHGACGILPSGFAAPPHQVYYYVAHTVTAVVANGSIQADSGGNFNLTFTVPSSSVEVEFAANITFPGWVHFYDAIHVADPGLIHITNLTIGKVAHVSVEVASVSGSVGLALYNATNVTNPDLSTWMPITCCIPYETLPADPRSPFVADVVLPRFLPKNQDYLLTVVANLPGLGSSYEYSEVVHMSNAPPAASATFSASNLVAGQAMTANASGSSDPDGVIVAYRFDWGDGNSTGWLNGPSATHAYSGPGTYTVTVSVQDDTGTENSTTYSLTVEPGILGVRASTFYLVAISVVVVAATAIAAAVYHRRRRMRPRKPTPPEALSSPPPESEPPRPPQGP